LDARLGKDGYAVVLTSDHGATPLVERARVASAKRLSTKDLSTAAETSVVRDLGPGPWVADLSSDGVYMKPGFEQASEQLRGRAPADAAKPLAALPNIATVGRTERFKGDCSANKDLERAICNSIVPGESGELYLYPIAGSLVTDYKPGTPHDAPFDDNRRVPIL